jgi:hypothetical protein
MKRGKSRRLERMNLIPRKKIDGNFLRHHHYITFNLQK